MNDASDPSYLEYMHECELKRAFVRTTLYKQACAPSSSSKSSALTRSSSPSLTPPPSTTPPEFPYACPAVRLELLDWLMEFCESLAFSRMTCNTAIQLLDFFQVRAFEEKETSLLRHTHLQLVGIACLWIASKLGEPNDVDVYVPKKERKELEEFLRYERGKRAGEAKAAVEEAKAATQHKQQPRKRKDVGGMPHGTPIPSALAPSFKHARFKQLLAVNGCPPAHAHPQARASSAPPPPRLSIAYTPMTVQVLPEVFCWGTAWEFSIDQVINMEGKVLELVDWNIHAPSTALHFLGVYLTELLDDYLDCPAHWNALFVWSINCLDFCMQSPVYLRFRPSMWVAATLYCACVEFDHLLFVDDEEGEDGLESKETKRHSPPPSVSTTPSAIVRRRTRIAEAILGVTHYPYAKLKPITALVEQMIDICERHTDAEHQLFHTREISGEKINENFPGPAVPPDPSLHFQRHFRAGRKIVGEFNEMFY